MALIAAVLSILAGLSIVGSQAAAAPPAPTGWTTTASYDFNEPAGTQPSTADWLYDQGHSYPYPGAAWNWGTGEKERVTSDPKNVAFDGQGNLLITEVKEANGEYTSARIETQRTDFAAPAGGQLKVTARLKQPSAVDPLGLWPAFWMLGADARPVGATNWPHIGEIDIMESVSGLQQVSHTFHCGAWAQPPCNEPEGISSDLLPCPGCNTSFHTYTAIIDRSLADEEVRFYTDDVLQHRVRQSQVRASSPDGDGTWNAAVHHGFFLILNLAIDGSYVDKVCRCDSVAVGNPTSGASMAVDYVAVYTKGGGTTPTTSTTSTASPTTTSTTAPTSTTAVTSTPTSSTTTTTATPVAGTPSSLRVGSTTANSITLKWDGPAGASYDVLRSGQRIATVTGTTFTDIGLLPNTPYLYSVRGGGVTTAEITAKVGTTPSTTTSTTTSSSTPPAATTTTTAPATGAPSGLKGTATRSSVSLTWTGSSTTSYDILRGEDGVKIASVTGTSFIDSNLGSNTPYVYSVRNSSGVTPQVTIKTLP